MLVHSYNLSVVEGEGQTGGSLVLGGQGKSANSLRELHVHWEILPRKKEGAAEEDG